MDRGSRGVTPVEIGPSEGVVFPIGFGVDFLPFPDLDQPGVSERHLDGWQITRCGL